MAQYVPDGQDVHAVAPVLAWNVPAAQLVQADAEEAEYVPTRHAEHSVDEVAAYLPALHTSMTTERPVVAQKLPVGHGVHAVDPVEA